MARDWKSIVRARLAPLPLDFAREADVVDELAQHVAQHFADLTAAGMPAADAEAAALAPLADRARVAAAIARADRPRPVAPSPPDSRSGLLTGLGRDVRYAARVLRRTPGFTAVALVTLALGIGANTAIFTVINAVLLRPLPYADASRLVFVGELDPDGSANNVGFTTFDDWRQQAHAFDGMALIRSWGGTITSGGQPDVIRGMRVTSNFFGLLGVRPALGRDMRTDDDRPDTWHELIISDALWRRRFDADPSVIGRVVQMNDEDYTIIGVMPASFEPLLSEHFYQQADMWAPLGYDRSLSYACRTCEHLKAIARLRADVTMDAARADINRVEDGLRAAYPSQYSPATMTLVPFSRELTGEVRPILAVLMGAVAFVLLIACANVANLLLARLARREHDLALRAALGAGRARIVRQLMVESALVAAAGGALGIALGWMAVPLLTRLAPANLSRLDDPHPDAHVLLFSLAITAATAVLFGLLPALRASRVDLRGSLQGDARKTSGPSTSAARRVLVAGNVAMAVVLLVGAGLMIKSVGRLLHVDPGFDPSGVLTFRTVMDGARYRRDVDILGYMNRIVERLGALPGATAAAAAGQIPLGGNGDRWGFHVEGRAWGPTNPSVERYSVTPGYFKVMRIPLERGRLFTDADGADAEHVMLVGEHTARTLWPDGDPLGQHVKVGSTDGPWWTVVGIVGDVVHGALDEAPSLQMYLPQAQQTDSNLTFVVRTSGDPSRLAAAARDVVQTVSDDLPVFQVATLEGLEEHSAGPRRFLMTLLELFSALALILTAVGVYGVISYVVAERTREIGLRTALGATPGNIVGLIVGQGIGVVAAGLVAGIVLSMAAMRLLESSLFHVSASDPWTFAGVAGVLLVVALIALTAPVARALRVDPAVALRQE